MKIISKILAAALCIAPSVAFSQTITIDVKANNHAISPYIYGSNVESNFTTSARWGGNRSTGYNWENNASNGGNDYSNVSDGYYTNFTDVTTPALPIVNFVKNADARNQFKIVSLQAAGYVAADKNGQVTEVASDDNPRWKKLSYEKPTPYSLTPDTEDDVVYIDEMINYLQTLGEPGNGGVDAYAVDNEPYLWSASHPMLHPQQTTYQELLEKTRLVASTVHKISPRTEIVGPMFFGWTDAARWGFSNDNNSSNSYYNEFRNNPNRPTDYRWFVDFYLDSLHQMEQQFGERFLDIISFHWYPEATGTETKYTSGPKQGQLVRIVNTSTSDGATPAQLLAEDVVEARLQAPRTLWDNTYKEKSYVGNEFSMLPKSRRSLLQAIKYSIDTYYPGTKIAFTEFEYDAEGHWSGGLALVDVLGIFGREDVYLATKWNPFQSYSTAAYMLYLNYDGKGNGFGTTSVQDVFTDTAKIASYASLDDNGNLHIIAVNKTATDLSTNFVLQNGTYSDGVVYGFDQNSSDITLFTAIDKIENSEFSYTLPARSALHFVLNVIKQTVLVKAQLFEDTKITVTLEDNITLQDAEVAKNEFSVFVDEEQQNVTAVSIENNVAYITLENPVANTAKISISYAGSNVIGKNNLPVDKTDDFLVTNELPTAPMLVDAIEISPIGKFVKLTFSKAIGEVSGNGGIVVQNGENALEVTAEKSNESDYDLYLYPTTRIFKYDLTTVSSTDNTILKDVNGVAVSDFTVTDKAGANYTPVIDSAVIADNFTINVYFDANMDPTMDYAHAGFHITERNPKTDEVKELDFITSYRKLSRTLEITTVPPLLQGYEYTFKYDGDDVVQTIHQGVLEHIEIPLENNLTSGGTIVSVPGVIQADEFWFQTGGPVKGESTDDDELGNGTELGYTSAGDYYTYFISVDEAKKYTLTVRYSADAAVGYDGMIGFLINGNSEINYIKLPATGSFTEWASVHRVIELPVGDSIEFKMKVEKSGFNLNYFHITDEELYPEIALTKSYIVKDGNILFLIYDKEVTTLPETSEFVLTADGERVNVSHFEYVNGDMKKIRCYLASKIYKNQEVLLSFETEKGTSIEGAILPTMTEVAITNNSVISKPIVAINTVDKSSFVVSPNPVKANTEVVLSYGDDEEVSYTILSGIGTKLSTGKFTKETTVSFSKSGVYFISLQTSNGTITEKIIVE
ncbi:MAG: T9SS type A sorting domain-containing protein [Bacteroidales bacterium]|nr:T9SS type A sorting domain-containing protein [Bacteroidales bacterium]